MLKRTIFAVVLGCAAITAMAGQPKFDVPEISIKGLVIGMPIEATNAIVEGRDTNEVFSVGGVRTKENMTPTARGLHGKLDWFLYEFDPSGFDAVMTAIKSKYPATKCEGSSVQNMAGATFNQTVCRLTSKNAVMTVKRFSTDINTGILFLESREHLEKFEAEAKKKESDI